MLWWQVAQVDKAILSQQGKATFDPPPDNIPGAEGHAEFRFLAVTTGTSSLQMAYTRPWEKNTAPARTFTLQVSVRPAGDRPMPQP